MDNSQEALFLALSRFYQSLVAFSSRSERLPHLFQHLAYSLVFMIVKLMKLFASSATEQKLSCTVSVT